MDGSVHILRLYQSTLHVLENPDKSTFSYISIISFILSDKGVTLNKRGVFIIMAKKLLDSMTEKMEVMIHILFLEGDMFHERL